MTDLIEKFKLSKQDVIASFNIPYVQFLNAQAQAIKTLPTFANKENLTALYTKMFTLRTFDTKTINLQRTGKLGTYASTLGQEAISVGAGAAMQQNDVLAPYYRDYGAQLQRGVSMTELLQYWGGDERGNAYANCPEDFPISVPIASQCLHATGIAKAIQYRKEDRAVVTTCGEGGTSKGDFYEALNLAGAWQLPVVFLVNNNQWAISVARSSQTHSHTIAQKAIAGGFEGIQVDGNDVIAVKEVMTYALEKARHGDGPTLIEAMTYRLCDHTTADDASRYRNQAEVEQAWQKEPIKRLRTYLEQQGWWDNDSEAELQVKAAEQVNDAVQAYLNKPKAEIDSIFDYMYEQITPELMLQKAHAKQFGGK
ncbi:MAG: pyruvate dehydrogenase (acetyl-transferring) E1 component subunit alpha [Legionellales bacterium]|nr:pyruvate dehydrogenase (acetyl-transferring) E1 component subunit alpha [Legionellales bacterium]